MIATSRSAEPAVYVASIALHTTGIVLLFQYLFMRNNCPRCIHGSSNQEAVFAHTLRHQPPFRLSMSEFSTTSDEYTRKRRRPHTTYGGGGDYLRRESFNSSWESFQPVTVDRTASGRRIPPRSPKFDSRPRTAEAKSNVRLIDTELKRSKSYSGKEKCATMREESWAYPDLTSVESRENVLELRRQGSGRLLRRRSDQISLNNESRVQSSIEETASPQNASESNTTTTVAGEVQQPILRPILLPPLPRFGLGERPEREERPSNAKPSSDEPNPLPANSKPRVLVKSSPVEQPLAPPSNSASSSSSNFNFPFQNPEESVEHDEDYINWRPRTDVSGISSSEAGMEQIHSWSLNLEDLIGPHPPFASEDRHYFCSTPSDSRPSESRLSTITEEGTVRESVVATPPNIIVTDTLHGKF